MVTHPPAGTATVYAPYGGVTDSTPGRPHAQPIFRPRRLAAPGEASLPLHEEEIRSGRVGAPVPVWIVAHAIRRRTARLVGARQDRDRSRADDTAGRTDYDLSSGVAGPPSAPLSRQTPEGLEQL